MIKNKLDCRDGDIARYLSVGLKEEILRLLQADEKEYCMVFLREESDDQIAEDDSGEYTEDTFSSRYGNKIYLTATTISHDNLFHAALMDLDGFNCVCLQKDKEARTKKGYDREGLIIYYRNVSDIDFTDRELDGFTLCSQDIDFEEKFSKRNLSIIIKKYKTLLGEFESYSASTERARKRLEDFKEGLSEEELLAINVSD